MTSKPTRPQSQTATQEDQTDAAARRSKGEFVRGVSGFRAQIGDAAFPPEPGRYHLFVALNCPWCHRVTLARAVLGLDRAVTMDVAFPNRTDDTDPVAPNLWEFAPARRASLTQASLPECTAETATGQGYRLMREIYQAESSAEQSVPVLYDKHQKCIVSNESADILRMLDANAEALGSELSNAERPRLFAGQNAEIRAQIDALNALTYTAINNGAYKAGFSSSQQVYAEAFAQYFEALAQLEARLSDGRSFLMGDDMTEADVRLFPTLFRHDPVYVIRMKLNGARILDFPHLWHWLCRMHGARGVAGSSALVHCRQGYFGRSWNGVIPLGPFAPMPYPEAYDHPELAPLTGRHS